MKTQFKSFLAIAILFVIAVSALDYFRSGVTLLQLKNTAFRRISTVCQALSNGDVTLEDLCKTPITEISYFYEGYLQVLNQDGQWFAEKGWLYYPEVTCAGDELTLGFMGRHFRCDGSTGELVSGDFESVYPNSVRTETETGTLPKQCHERETHRREQKVVRVESDGTIVLDSNERIILQGVELPESKPNAKSGENCLEDTVKFIKGQLENRPVFVYQKLQREVDERFRIYSYLVTERGVLLNLELVRYGLALAAESEEGEEGCAKELTELEGIAKQRKIGLWEVGCFSGKRGTTATSSDETPGVIKIVPAE